MAKRSHRDDERRQELLEAALRYPEEGIPVVPLHSINAKGRCTCGKKQCSSPGKHPRTRNGFRDATTDKSKIRRWWRQWPDANIGGALGDKFVAIDVDPKNGGPEGLKELEDEFGALPKTATARTGKHGPERGRHHFFLTGDLPIGSKANVLDYEGVDVRGHRGYVVLPPSRHRSGVNYEFVVPLSKAVAMPEALEDALSQETDGKAATGDRNEDWEPSGTPLSKEVRGLLRRGDWPSGQQRAIAEKCCRALIASKQNWDEVHNGGRDEIVAELLDALERSDQNRDEPWRAQDIEDLVDDFIKNPPPEKGKKSSAEITLSLTDAGNADRFAEQFSGEARYVPEWKSWVFWVGDRWQKDAEVLVTRRMLKVAKTIPSEINYLGDSEDDLKLAGKVYSWAERSLSAQRIKAAVELAKAHPALLARAPDFDSHRYLLNCRNGTLDLRTGELRPHRREDMLTQQVRCDFDQKATSKDWEKVLREAFDGSEEMVTYLRRVFGYSLTGDTSEEKFFFFYGKSGAGKGTILEAFGGMLGDYQRAVDSKTLTKGAPQSGGAASENIARLHGGRFAVSNEFEAGERFAAAQVNTLTGRDKIAARFLHQNTFEFYPQFKLFIAANDRPQQSSNPESGVWRRIQVVPFDHKVAKVDKDLKSRLQTDEARTAILAWALRGCLEWQQDGLGDVPAQVADAVDDYKEASDPHREFIEARLERSKGNFIPNKVMWDTYQAWAEKEGIRRPVAQRTLTSILKERGFEQAKKRTPGGSARKVWVGVRVRGLTDQMQRKFEEAR